MTPIDFQFVTPDGLPVSNAAVDIQFPISGYAPPLQDKAMPLGVLLETDMQGQLNPELWPCSLMYFLTLYLPDSGIGLHYRFFVPQLDEGLSRVVMQPVVVDLETAGTFYDDAPLLMAREMTIDALALTASANAALRALPPRVFG